MATETCPAALPLCVLGHRGCAEHERWVPVQPLPKPRRFKRRRHR
jgi:hypothetical protein